jgi:phage baseplate assembly protein gpV
VNINCKQANITASESVTVDTPTTVFTGNVQIDQNLTVDGSSTLSSTVTSNGKDISDTHTHGGSPTAPSGAVSNTGAPT